MSKVTKIFNDIEYMARCPACTKELWIIHLDDINDNWENIIGTECATCGFFVDWVLAKKTTNESH